MRALLLFVAACGGSPSPAPAPQQPKPAPAPPSEETFTGTITYIKFGCAVDASCDLIVDNAKRVHFGHDTRIEGSREWGNTEEVFALMETPNQGVGKRIEVFALKTGPFRYTLQSKSGYIKVLP